MNPCISVSHQLKVFTAANDVAGNSSVLSSVGGARIMDGTWKSLKEWLPKLVPKVHVDGESIMNQEIAMYVYQRSWRRSQNISDAGNFFRQFLSESETSFKKDEAAKAAPL